MRSDSEIIGKFESDREPKVRENHSCKRYSRRNKLLAENWLRHKEKERSDAAIERAELREDKAILIAERAAREAERANSISEMALSVARHERTIAVIAMILSASAVITSIIAVFITYLEYKKHERIV
jgi:hypothetical protein